MRKFTLKQTASTAYAGILEKIEILRSTLRWAKKLERDEIQRLFKQTNALRDEVLAVSRNARFFAGAELEPLRGNELDEQSSPTKTPRQRRQALIDQDFVFEGVFGENKKLLEALEISRRAAPTDLPVLIGGESGTGKELLAKVVHANGSRSDGSFVTVNCGAIPESLIESELFGHKKGAFTGAASDRKGKFESANGGTIFLDEIGELPLSGQVKLLRVLQSQEIQRVGSDDPIRVDTRVVAATHRDLLAMARAGSFREDLYYRLGVLQVTVPPLRERIDEIPLLLDYFCDEAAEKLRQNPIRMTPALRAFLLSYDYPGNIRELRNIVYRISCLADEIGETRHLPDALRPAAEASRSSTERPASDTLSLSDVKRAASDAAERHFLEQGLKETHGRVTELAKRLDMNRSHLQTLLKKHGLNSKMFRAKSNTTSP